MLSATPLLVVIIILLLVILLVLLFKSRAGNYTHIHNELIRLNADVSRVDPLIRSEFSGNRNELAEQAHGNRQELRAALQSC